MKLKNKDTDTFFYFIPAIIGILMIIFSISIAFNKNVVIYNEVPWVIFWVFLGLVLISHDIVSFYSVSFSKKDCEIKECSSYTAKKSDNTICGGI